MGVNEANPVGAIHSLGSVVGGEDFDSVLDGGHLHHAGSVQSGTGIHLGAVLLGGVHNIGAGQSGVAQFTVEHHSVVAAQQSGGRSHDVIEGRLNQQFRHGHGVAVLLDGNLLGGAAHVLSDHVRTFRQSAAEGQVVVGQHGDGQAGFNAQFVLHSGKLVETHIGQSLELDFLAVDGTHSVSELNIVATIGDGGTDLTCGVDTHDGHLHTEDKLLLVHVICYLLNKMYCVGCVT